MWGFTGFLILAFVGGGLALLLGLPPIAIVSYFLILLLLGALTGFSRGQQTDKSRTSNNNRESSRSRNNSRDRNNNSKALDAANNFIEASSSSRPANNRKKRDVAGANSQNKGQTDENGPSDLENIDNEIRRELNLEREELDLDEDILNALNDAMQRFENLEPMINELKEISSDGTIKVMDIGAILEKHNKKYPSEIKKEVFQLRDDLGTILEDLNKKNQRIESEKVLEAKAEGQIQQIAQNQLADLQNVVNAIDQASDQNVEVASNFN